jgi:hypothetical protein
MVRLLDRTTNNTLSSCVSAPITGLHLWMQHGRVANPKLDLLTVFCSRCGTRGVFTLAELAIWKSAQDAAWERTGRHQLPPQST